MSNTNRLAFRASDEDRQKLLALSNQFGLNPSETMRAIIRQSYTVLQGRDIRRNMMQGKGKNENTSTKN